MAMNRKALARIAAAIERSNTFFVAGHVKPDGDTVGCALALESLLKRRGKKVKLFTREPVPGYLRFLTGTSRIRPAEKVKGRFDCAIILECSDLARMGNLISLDQASTVLNIDHHAVASDYGDVNYVDPHASSSSEQIFYLFQYLKTPLLRNEAEALYVGLVTDTGKFQQANTTPDALHMAAALLEAGVVPEKLYEKLYASNNLSTLHLLGAALDTLTLTADGRVAYLKVTNEMYRATGSNVTETEGIINNTLTMPKVMIGIMFRETDVPGQIKVSLRSRANCDVNRVARHFGGGGHKKAAGCSIKGTIESAEKQLLRYIDTVLK